MATVGIRELKDRLSEFLRRVGEGERITVTARGRPIAVIEAPTPGAEKGRLTRMLRDGIARWDGGRPRGTRRPARLRGKPVAETILEERH